MGKGDIKSKKGKRSAGSYGVSRQRKEAKPIIEVKPEKENKSVKKAKSEPTEAKKTVAKKTTARKTTKEDAAITDAAKKATVKKADAKS